MKEQRPYSLVKAIVYYLVIAAASTLASSPASTDAIAPESSNEPQKSVGIILPNWGRYEDPTLPVSQDYHLDDYYTGFTSFSYHIIDLLKLGIDWANSGGKEEAWIIAEDTTATQLINYYEEIVTALHEKGFYDYKIILLNPRGPSWRPIDLDKLDAINDPNLMIVTYDPQTPTTTEVLEVGSRALPYDETRRLIRFKKPTNAKSVTLRTAAKGWETDIDLQPSVNDPQILEIDRTTLNLPKGKNEFKFYINGDWEE